MVNKIILVGRCGRNPETKDVNGVQMAQFSLATSETYKDKNGQKQEATEWHNVTCWRNLADIVGKYCHSGDLLYVEGRVHYRSWDGNDGAKHYATDIIANEIRMLGGKRNDAPRQGQSSAVVQPNYDRDDSDLPFK